MLQRSALLLLSSEIQSTLTQIVYVGPVVTALVLAGALTAVLRSRAARSISLNNLKGQTP